MNVRRTIALNTVQLRDLLSESLLKFENLTAERPRKRIFNSLKTSTTSLLMIIKDSILQLTRKDKSENFNTNENPSKRNLSRIIVPVILIVIVALGLRSAVGLIRGNSGGNGDSRVEIVEAKENADINREFEFPLKDSEGNEVSKLKYMIESADLHDEIVVKGQKATAVKGRTFLILRLKITNEFDQPIEINTRDYARLIRNDNEEEKLAPDIHNDPVQVQAISTKLTRIGFPINDTDTNLMLLVGEITGDKETIEINFD